MAGAATTTWSTSAMGHVRVDHARDEFTKGTVHINGIEGFWGLAKVRLTQFKGLPKHTFTPYWGPPVASDEIICVFKGNPL